MNKTFVINNCQIKVSFDTGLIRIVNDDEFRRMLSTGLLKSTGELVYIIRQNYKEEYGRELRISNRSLAVEIWGHVFGEYLVHAVHQKLRCTLTGKLERFVKKRCEIIDSGEKRIDNNRILWDVISPAKMPLGWLLNRMLQKHS